MLPVLSRFKFPVRSDIVDSIDVEMVFKSDSEFLLALNSLQLAE